VRWLVLALTLGGCDYLIGLDKPPERPVFELESKTHDEDGDDIADRDDLCPHRAAPEDDDFDGDGIGDACDPRPEQEDLRYFFAFEGGATQTLVKAGQVGPGADGDSIDFGDPSVQHSALTLPITASIVDIEAGVTIVMTKQVVTGYAELGLFSVHRSFDGKAMRGDVCFLGTDASIAQPPNYIEFDNDDVYLPDHGTRFDAAIVGSHGIFTQTHDTSAMRCDFTRAGGAGSHAGGGAHKVVPRTLTGQVALATTEMKVNLGYLWVVTPRP